MTDPSSVDGAVAKVATEFGSVDVLILNAGLDKPWFMHRSLGRNLHPPWQALVMATMVKHKLMLSCKSGPKLLGLLQVFDQALQGGGAKSINFQDLAADLAQITFDYPFQIPPYFALIIRRYRVPPTFQCSTP